MAFVVADIVFVTRPERTDRRREIEGIDHLLARCAKVVRIEAGTIEGGDVIVLPQWVLVGLGEKTDIAATDALTGELEARCIDRQVVPLHLALSSVVHLDCVFNPVSPDVALVYPPALTDETLGWLRRRFDLIEATFDETTALQVNTVNLDARTAVMTPGSDRLAEQLARRGLEVLIAAYDEVNLPVAQILGLSGGKWRRTGGFSEFFAFRWISPLVKSRPSERYLILWPGQ